MHTGYISFCDKWGMNIKSHEVKEEIMKELETKFQVKIMKKHHDKWDPPVVMPKLQTNPHIVCLRTNGNPYYLYLTRYQYTPLAIFIDKKIQGGYFLPRMIIGKCRFSAEAYDNTLLEGEMTKDMYGNWLFLIHDAIAWKNSYLEKENVMKRINLAYELLANHFVPDDTDVFQFHVKKYVTYDKLRELVYDFMPLLPYTCRGLYFRPLYLRFRDILYNFDESLIKKVQRVKYQEEKTFMLGEDIQTLKDGVAPGTPSSPAMPPPSPSPLSVSVPRPPTPPSNATSSCVFVLEKTQWVDVYTLYESRGGASVGIACIPDTATSKMLQDMCYPLPFHTKLHVECRMHPRFKRWQPLKILGMATLAPA